MAKSAKRGMNTLVYPGHQLSPEDLLGFIELKQFTRDWKTLKLNDDDLCALQVCLCCGPKMGSVIRGTGGLRKGRFSPQNWKAGRSNALRVCYAYLEDHHIILLARAYPKKVKDDLTADERKEIKGLINHIDAALGRGMYN